MSELTIHDVPAEVIKALEADAMRMNKSVDEIAGQLLVRSLPQSPSLPLPGFARLELDRIREEIRRSHGTFDVVIPMLREDRIR